MTIGTIPPRGVEALVSDIAVGEIDCLLAAAGQLENAALQAGLAL